jgi:phosphomannomutase
LPQYVIVKKKYDLQREKLPVAYNALRSRWPKAVVNDLDGLRLDLPEGWLHVRGSNTEPVVRVIAEAADEAKANDLCDEAGGILNAA